MIGNIGSADIDFSDRRSALKMLIGASLVLLTICVVIALTNTNAPLLALISAVNISLFMSSTEHCHVLDALQQQSGRMTAFQPNFIFKMNQYDIFIYYLHLE